MSIKSLFARIFRIGKANAHATLDAIEDPQKMLDQSVRDYTNNIAAAESAVACNCVQVWKALPTSTAKPPMIRLHRSIWRLSTEMPPLSRRANRRAWRPVLAVTPSCIM